MITMMTKINLWNYDKWSLEEENELRNLYKEGYFDYEIWWIDKI